RRSTPTRPQERRGMTAQLHREHARLDQERVGSWERPARDQPPQSTAPRRRSPLPSARQRPALEYLCVTLVSPANSAVDRAGSVLRDILLRRDEGYAEDDLDDFIDTVAAFRSSFQDAYAAVGLELHVAVSDVAPESVSDITGRPKRMTAIASKLQ